MGGVGRGPGLEAARCERNQKLRTQLCLYLLWLYPKIRELG